MQYLLIFMATGIAAFAIWAIHHDYVTRNAVEVNGTYSLPDIIPRVAEGATWIPGGQSEYNNRNGDHWIRIQVRFATDCWEELYARATPKGANQKALNWQYIYNNDEPDNGRSEVVNVQWKFKGATVQQYSSEGKIRVYAELEFPDGSYGPTITQYKIFNAADKYFYFYFNLQTKEELCK